MRLQKKLIMNYGYKNIFDMWQNNKTDSDNKVSWHILIRFQNINEFKEYFEISGTNNT